VPCWHGTDMGLCWVTDQSKVITFGGGALLSQGRDGTDRAMAPHAGSMNTA
jgi:hypothetical protein